MLENLLPFFTGIIAGIFTGLVPGIHINLITATLLTLPLTNIPVTILVIFIVSLSITHTFIDFIPSIYLGAASEDSCLSILPGHKYLLKGEGQKAVHLTLIGSTIAIIVLIIVIPLFFLLINILYPLIQKMMGWILIWIIFFLFYQENKSKFWAITIFFLAGILGNIAFNTNLNQPLLPLLTGLFGSSTIINSILTKTNIPKQKTKKLKIAKKELIKPTIATAIISPLCSFLPGLGSSQAAKLSTKIVKDISTREFLILLGSINTLVIAISFITLYLTNKTRTGSAQAISQITTLTPNILKIILITIIATTTIAYPLTLTLSKIISKNIHKINYTYISTTIFLFLTIIIITMTGTHGLLIYTTATTLGLLAIKTGTTKSHLMGAILLPTTLYYLPIF